MIFLRLIFSFINKKKYVFVLHLYVTKYILFLHHVFEVSDMHTSALSERNSKGRLRMCMKPFVKIASDTYSKNAIKIRNEVKQD